MRKERGSRIATFFHLPVAPSLRPAASSSSAAPSSSAASSSPGASSPIRALCLALASLVFSGCGGRGGPSGPDAPELAQGDYQFTVGVDGRSRTYLVRVPSRPAGERNVWPTLLAFHGGGGNPNQFRATAGLDALADAEGIVVVYPAGTGQLASVLTWNAGPGCCGYARDQGVDDVAFVRSLIQDLSHRHPIDPDRIYVTGHSNGSMMAYRVAAQAPDVIAGAVGVAGTMQLPSVSPTAPVPILHIHSRDDPRAFYDGGTREDRVHPPVADMLDRWISVNGCAEPPAEIEGRAGGEGTPDAGQTARLLRWSCSRASLEHWRLTGVGHAWPGHRASPARELIVGPSTELVDAPEEIWRFLEGIG